MIEAHVNDAWCPLTGTAQITGQHEPSDELLLNGALIMTRVEVAHPELGAVWVHPRTFAWRGRARVSPSPEAAS